jgi:hypothetical protein
MVLNLNDGTIAQRQSGGLIIRRPGFDSLLCQTPDSFEKNVREFRQVHTKSTMDLTGSA